jgi:hypothetical protein
MSRALFNRNPDLKRLRDEGYFVQVVGGLLLMREVPYVDSHRQVRRGTLITTLTMAGDQTRTPDDHVVHFDGDFPCDAEGRRLERISHASAEKDWGHGVTARHSFSSKPEGGYPDYYAKMTSYASMLAGHAAVLQAEATPLAFRAPEDAEESVFNYVDTASDRAGIGALADRLAGERVAIVGVGGTGSYILDFVAKTPVAQIRLIDGDEFLLHNAFRAPGAPSIEELRDAPKKVDYLANIYSRMHRGITAHPLQIGATNLHLLDGVTFAFLSMDAGEVKRLVVQKLETNGAAFVDVGMGLELDGGSLGGILRVTASTPDTRGYFHDGHVSYAGGGAENIYASNIQVADLNALNATLAVIRWKKIRGFYRDLDREHHSTYTTDGNLLLNEVVPC